MIVAALVCVIGLVLYGLFNHRQEDLKLRREVAARDAQAKADAQPHIVMFDNGEYGVRKSFCDSWEFLGTTSTTSGQRPFWWLLPHIENGCRYPTLARATAALQQEAAPKPQVVIDVGVKVTSSND